MCNHHVKNSKPKSNPYLLLREIFERFGQDYVDKCNPMSSQKKILEDVIKCCTPEIGRGYEQYCADCNETHVYYNSCQNRGCPRCHWSNKKKWVKTMITRLPKCSYSFVTVTAPQELSALISRDQKFWYDILLAVSADAIKDMADNSLGGLPIILATLQTWNHKLDYHPHGHFIVSNGGSNPDGEFIEPNNPYWIQTNRLSLRIKELVLKRIKQNQRHWSSRTYGHIERCIRKGHWEVDCQPFGKECYDTDDNGNAISKTDHGTNSEMLLKYVSRDALAGHRIIDIDDEYVVIAYKNHRRNRDVEEIISGVEYIKRFMEHVLPKRFQHVRHYGLLHSSKTATLKKIKSQFDKKFSESGGIMDQWLQYSESLVQEDQEDVNNTFAQNCSHCGNRTLKSSRIFFKNNKTRKSHFSYGESRAGPPMPHLD